MKKQAAIIIIGMSLVLIGCNNQKTQIKDDTGAKSSIEQAQPQQSTQSNTEISIDQAKEIALKDANVTSDKVTFVRAELDYDNGVKKYSSKAC